MKSTWEAVQQALLGPRDQGVARRLANFVVAAALGRARGLSVTETKKKLDFGDEVAALIKAVGSDLPFADCPWAMLEHHLEALFRPDPDVDYDRWVEAFQASGPNRKSLGAYATPSVFADVLAAGAIPVLPNEERLRVIDPAAGAGNLLLAAYRRLVSLGADPITSVYALHGVELDPAARELCVLMLWLSAAAGADLSRIAANVVLDNALTRDWWAAEPFDVLLMNPPWESLRHQAAEELDQSRAETLRRLDEPRRGAADLPDLYTAHGRGDRNLFKAFVELAPHLIRRGGRIGALVPAAFGSDLGMAPLRQRYLEQLSLEKWTSFENRHKHFAIDSRYKFGLLFGVRSNAQTKSLSVLSFAAAPTDINAPHVELRREQLALLGGADCMIPELTSHTEKAVLLKMLEAGAPFFRKGPLGAVSYQRETDLTLGKAKGEFWHLNQVGSQSAQNDLFEQSVELVPLLEGRMVGQYDCFQKSWIEGEGRRARWDDNGERSIKDCRPQFVAPAQLSREGRIALCDVTSSTNTRTVLATYVPARWLCGNTAPVLRFETDELAMAGLAVLNSMVFDWMARRVVGGLHLNKFYLARLTWPRLSKNGVGRLADLGRQLAALHPRGGVALPVRQPFSERNSVARIAAFAAVEVEVARAYGLAIEDLEFILANDPSDRRGLWRYFSSVPYANDVARLTLEAFTGNSPPSSRIAA